MMRARSMRGETSAIIIISFLLSHVAGYLFYALDRRDAIEMTGAVDLAERAAGISRLLRDLPPSWRRDVIQFSDSRTFRVWSGDEPSVHALASSDEELEIAAYLRSQLPRIADHDMRVRFVGKADSRSAPPTFEATAPAAPPTAGLDPPEDGAALEISIRHAAGEWINFLGALNTPKSLLPELLVANLVSAVLGIALVAFWLVGRVTRPLARFAEAAEALGRDLFRPPLVVTGPAEVAVAAAAFNRMQQRLTRLIQSRTEMLAAISHDLRTPLTQIRLRLEMMPLTTERRKTLAAIDDMDATIGSFLSYARAAHDSEEKSRVDLGALVSSICDDLGDCGAPVTCDCESGLVIRCKRLAVKRAIVNLIDNAVKYGNEADVQVRRCGRQVVVGIADTGPGIPEQEMAAVLRPFHRGNRTQHGGARPGTGLGLSIAQAVVEDHGGELRLSNRPGTGLLAEIIFAV